VWCGYGWLQHEPGGSWPLPAEALAARDWARIEALAREAAALRVPGVTAAGGAP